MPESLILKLLDESRSEAACKAEQNSPFTAVLNEDEKFNASKHVGTIYDPEKGRRVPVSDVNMIPKVS
jgi:hypothetical protein